MQNNSNLSFHIQVLFDELRQRKQKNPLYSMRAFANQLEIHPSALSRAMAGKEELSLQACARMIKRLPLSDEDKVRFVTSVADEKYERVMKTLSAEFPPSFAPSLTPERIAVFDREHRYMLVAPRPLDFLKRSAAQIIGKTIHEAGFPPDIAEKMTAQNQGVLETGKPSVIEFKIECAEPKFFRRAAYGIMGEDGRVDRVLVHVRQIPTPS